MGRRLRRQCAPSAAALCIVCAREWYAGRVDVAAWTRTRRATRGAASRARRVSSRSSL